MIAILIFIILAFINSIFFASYFNKRSEESLPLIFFIIITIMFISGILNVLKIGVYAVFTLYIILGILTFIRIIKEKNLKQILSLVFTPALIIFLILIIILIFCNYNKIPYLWDEFSHWADTVKAMWQIDDFSTNILSNSTFKSYPPGLSVLQYFIIKISGGFNEWLLYFTYQLFALSLLFPFFKKISWKKSYKIILPFILILLVNTIFFNEFYNSVYVDAILSIVAGYTFASICIDNKYSIFNILNISGSLIALTLLKDIGIYFVFISIVLIVISFIFNKEISLKKKIFLGLYFLLLVCCTKLLWNHNVVVHNAAFSFSNKIDIILFLKELFGLSTTYRTTVIRNFALALSNRPIVIAMNLQINVIHLLIILLVFIIFINIRSKNTLKEKLNLIVIYLGLVGYIGVHMILYCFKFTEYEALALASFERYLSIYFNAVLIFILCNFIYNNNKDNIYNDYFLTFFLIISLSVPYNSIINFLIRNNVQESQYKSAKYIDLGKNLNSLTTNSSIFILSQNDKGYDKWASKYYFRPNNVKNEYWSFGEPYYDGDVWTYNFSLKELNNLIFNNYDYVVIYNVDEKFLERYGEIFENKNDAQNGKIYEIDKEKQKLVLK